MLSRILVTVVFSTLALSAQDTGGSSGGTPVIAIFPPPAVAYKEVQQYLGLSDQQVEALRAILVERDKALQEFWKQISDKQIELNQLLQSGSTDYSRIGQLMVEINGIQKQQYPGPKEPYRSQALAVLNPQQKAKLQTLADVLNLNTPAYQAVALDLLDRPDSVSPPMILSGSDASGSVLPHVAVTPAVAVK
jgi:hypothetical protein